MKLTLRVLRIDPVNAPGRSVISLPLFGVDRFCPKCDRTGLERLAAAHHRQIPVGFLYDDSIDLSRWICCVGARRGSHQNKTASAPMFDGASRSMCRWLEPQPRQILCPPAGPPVVARGNAAGGAAGVIIAAAAVVVVAPGSGFAGSVACGAAWPLPPLPRKRITAAASPSILRRCSRPSPEYPGQILPVLPTTLQSR